MLQPMPVTDAMFLIGEQRRKPLHVGGLQLFVPADDAGPEAASELYRRMVSTREVAPMFRKKPVRMLAGLGPWAWEDDAQLDLEYHVRHSALPRPGRIRELLALTSRLHGTLLDRSRPLWELHVIEGLDDGRIALYWKVHHALLDGVSAMRLMSRGLSTDPDERDMPAPFARRPIAGAGERDGGPVDALVSAGKGVVAGTRAVGEVGAATVRSAVRSLQEQAAALPFTAPGSVLNVPITGARRFAAESWDLERLWAVAARCDGSVNDVVLAMCAGALRRYLEDLGALPDRPLIAAVPVSMRDEDSAGGNRIGAVLCDLGTHQADAASRLRRIQGSMSASKEQMQGLSPLAMLLLSAANFGGIALGPLYRVGSLRRPPFNVIISNVPGPDRPLYFDGARLDGVYPASVPYDGQALNITVTSYAGHIEFGLIGCRRTLPSLQRLLDHLEASLAELEDCEPDQVR